MNCTACSNPIDKTNGYYLVMGAPYCIKCYQPQGDVFNAHTNNPPRQEPESLLEAFRAYQKRSKAATCHNF